MADRKPKSPGRIGASPLGPIRRPTETPYRHNTVSAPTHGEPDDKVEPTAPTPVAAPDEDVDAAEQSAVAKALAGPKRKSRSSERTATSDRQHAKVLRISTRIPLTDALQRRMQLVTEAYDAEPSDAQSLTLRPVYERFRQVLAKGEFSDFRFVRTPRDLEKLQTTVSISAKAHKSIQKTIDPYDALSKSALMESFFYQIILQMESDQNLT